ncbi:MAG: DMT family transporter [Muribaculaceae bacterium]|nr:DMT family transporter [Muribaculaceae bacterium]
MKLKGYLFAALAAASYGTNPAFAVPLYGEGMNPTSVLLFRYLLSLPVLLLIILTRGQNLRLSRGEIAPVAILGVLMGLSSLGLFESYKYMNAGVASTLLFMYPVMVALLMSFFYHEKFRITTGLCLLIMAAGLILLVKTGGESSISLVGFLLVFLSSLTYAIYLVMTNVSAKIKNIPTVKLLFYQLLSGSLVFIFMLVAGEPLTLPTGVSGWVNVSALALLPTVMSLYCTTAAIHLIGSTPTAIFGALEPVTAVVLSVVILNQSMSVNEIFGGLLIVIATSMVVASDPIDHALLRMRKMFPPLRRVRSRRRL